MGRRSLGLLAGALLLAGCMEVARPPTVHVTGHWIGTWAGHGAYSIPRDEEVTLDLVQVGQQGEGRLVMQGTLAADSVPEAIRSAAMAGTRVVFEVSENVLRLEHELGSELFAAEMTVRGDRMVGLVLDATPSVTFVLTRVWPEAVAPAPAPASPPPPAPPPPPAEAPPAPAPAPTVQAPAGVVPPLVEAPARAAPSPGDFVAIPELQTIYFDFDRAEIRASDRAVLDASAAWLRAHPDHLVLIEGHCDERGTAEYNLALGERRARAVMVHLLGRGIAEAHVMATSYGVERPVCAQPTEACRALNRRATLLLKPF